MDEEEKYCTIHSIKINTWVKETPTKFIRSEMCPICSSETLAEGGWIPSNLTLSGKEKELV